MSRIKDLKGKRFGRWVVLENASPNQNCQQMWRCVCDCGTERVLKGSGLSYGTTKSCGCLRTDAIKAATAKRNARLGYAGGLHEIIGGYKRNAAKRGLEWAITDKEATEIMQRDCHYCGLPPSMEEKKVVSHNKIPFLNGIDRVDNKVGYNDKGNCVPCCKVCNHAKATMSQADFLSWVSRIAQHQGFTTYNPPPIQEDQSMKWTVM